MVTGKHVSRRSVLHGLLGGAAVTVGLPFFECFLNNSGTALADGAPLPVRFGTWFWGLGMNEKIWRPDKVGADYDLKSELEAIRPVRQHVNVFSRYRTDLGGRVAFPHYSGAVLLRCGQAPASNSTRPGESIDVTISDTIGRATRFPSLEMAASGNRRDSYSFRGTAAVNPPEISPMDLYRRVFGPEFQDPNSPEFTPNPNIMLRKSVLSAVREESASLRSKLGSADRQRLDAYFTTLRGAEERLALQLQKPPPAPSCKVAGAGLPVLPAGLDVELVDERHRLMTDLLVMALACNQTRVFNMVYSSGGAGTTKKGVPHTHHMATHEEGHNDAGYQELHSWFLRRAMGAWAYLVGALDSVPEGDGTLLDNTLIYAHSEHQDARAHDYKGIPMMTAGRAGGRIRSGLHIDGRHDVLASALGLTLLQAMGLDIGEWGAGPMRTSSTVSEILV